MKGLFRKSYRVVFIIVLAAGAFGAYRVGLVDYLLDPENARYVMGLTGQHLMLVAVSMFMATAVGLAVGIIFTRRRLERYSGVVLYIIGLGQTIPSLAIIALSLSILGIGVKPAVFALFIYSILPIARNTLAGILAVPHWMIDAAKGMGLTPFRILVEVELPNAMKVILTGFRVALVINIGTAALAFLIGAGGLGDLIFTGIDLMQTDRLLAGAVPTALLALMGDYLCGLLGLVLVPRGLRLGGQ